MAEDDPWVIEDPEEAARAEADAAEAEAAQAAAEAEAAPAEGAAAESGAAPGGEDAAPEEGLRPPVERDPNAPILCKHWIRPKFLNYSYIYDYRHKYYDDVISYLDKRQRGLISEIPRAQEWAERASRIYSSKGRSESSLSKTKDIYLLADLRSSAKFYRYHSNAFVHRKYAKYLYQ